MTRALALRAILSALLFCAMVSITAAAQGTDPDLSVATLQDLTQMQVKVSSFARRDQDLWTTPAAVFVITREDIERSAFSSIPELLRMVPGLQVAQINASTWAISARGFNSAYSTKLLVLVDGRTVYSEIFSGAQWDQNDLPLEEIERIEVIRGPGAAVWGTNAVNGVINIITRRARSTLGAKLSGRVSRLDDVASLRYGGALGDRIQYRAYAVFRDRRPLETATGEKAFDGEKALRGGGRLDWRQSTRDWFTVSGDLYKGHLRQQERTEIALPLAEGHDSGGLAGGYLLTRWERKLPHSDSALQVYYDETSRDELTALARTRTFATDFQYHFPAGSRNDVVWGSGLRITADHLAGPIQVTVKPEYHNYLVDGFFQDEISLVPRRLTLTVGSKIQQGTLAGFQLQPSTRLLWSPNEKQSIWAAVSRSAVAPSIQDKAVMLPLNLGVSADLPIAGELDGNPAIKPETVVSYELGYRRRITGKLTLDVASFFNMNYRLLSLAVANPLFVAAPSPHVFESLSYTNGFRANSTGIETSISWKPVRKLSFQSNYTWTQVHESQTQPGILGLADSWSTPRNSLNTNALWAFAPQWGLNLFLSQTDALPVNGTPQSALGDDTNVPSLTRIDLNLSYKLGSSTVIDAGGSNLLTDRHLEFGSSTGAAVPAYIPRSLFVRVKWAF